MRQLTGLHPSPTRHAVAGLGGRAPVDGMETVTGVPVRCMKPLVAVWLACEAPVRPEPSMTVARSVADVLADHVVFEVECIDRMSLNVYVPQLQYPAGAVPGGVGGVRAPAVGVADRLDRAVGAGQ
jgi:hypothetical protein